MTLKQMYELFNDNSSMILIFVLIILNLVEVSKIKINPVSALMKWFGKMANGDLAEKVDIVAHRLDKCEQKMGENKAVSARYRIIRFADEIQHDTKHSKEHFGQIISDIDDYEEYCITHPGFRNGMATTSIQIIKQTYTKCLKNNSFI